MTGGVSISSSKLSQFVELVDVEVDGFIVGSSEDIFDDFFDQFLKFCNFQLIF